MKLKEYKIETLGLNEAILHKAVEEGYDKEFNSVFFTPSAVEYLFLYDDGSVRGHCDKRDFEEDDKERISAHDFLRLNWTPKVGEEVECVDSRATNYSLKQGEKYVVSMEVNDWNCITVKGSKDHYDFDRFIPVLPRKPLPEQKPDAYIFDSAKLADGTWALYLIVREGDEDIKSRIYVDNAYKYNLLSESEYKKKYPDKLMFKNWEVEVDRGNVKIGCIMTNSEVLDAVYNHIHFSDASDEELKKVSLLDLYNFIKDNKEKLGL